MKTLREAVNDYLMMRRGLGFKLRHVEHDLGSFVSFMELEQAPFIRSDLALKWAMGPTDARPAYWAQRLSAVRGFARYRSATDPSTQVPPAGLLPFQNQRTQPYLYTDEDIERLMTAAKTLRPRDGLRSWTYYCLFGLLTVTGLRISELIALERRDVDLQEGLLMIRGTKSGKSRIVPLHDSTRHALTDYADRRDRHPDRKSAVKFLVSDHGGPLEASTVRRTFYHLSRQTGLRGEADGYGPRLHDFRHNSGTGIIPSTDREGAVLLEDRAISDASMAA